MAQDTGTPQTVAIHYQRGGRGPFSTLRTVTLSDPEGYFDVRAGFPAGGNVRLAYTFPTSDPLAPAGQLGTTIYSRLVSLTTPRTS
jgi:hypothetical protein